MLKRLSRLLLAGTIGFLTIIAGYFSLGLHPGTGPISNEQLVAELLLPIPIGGVAAWAVYRVLARLSGDRP